MKIYFHQILLRTTFWQVNAFSNQFVIVRVAGDQRFVVRERHSWKIFEQVVTVAYLKKKIKFHLKPTVLKSLFNKVACLRGCNFLAKTVNRFQLLTIFTKSFILDIWHGSKSLSQKLSTYRCNTDVGKDPNGYRSSRPEVFYKKCILRNFAKFTGKHLCQGLFF